MMQPLEQHIVLTKFDHSRLNGLLHMLRERSGVNPWSLDALEFELRRAEVVPPDQVPGDVITMNSRVKLHDLANGSRFWVKLVFPGSRAMNDNCIPVLSPMGVSLLGCRAGQELRWNTEAGTQRLLIESVAYQPEAAGNYFL